MKRIIVLLLLAAAVGAAGFYLWKTFFGETDRDIIGRRLNEVSRVIGKIGKEGFVVQRSQAREISKYFDDICDVRLPRFNREAKMTREHIVQNAITLRNFSSTLELKVYDMEFYFQEGEPLRCKVLFTGVVNATLRTGERFKEGYDLETNWVKKDGEWLIEGVGFSGILEK